MPRKLLILYAIAMLLGIITGIVGSLFQLAIRQLSALISQVLAFLNTQGPLVAFVSALLSMILVLLAWYLVKRFAPEGGGSGVQEIEPLNWCWVERVQPFKWVGIWALC
jgi:CIC family chloride channel protein